MEFDILWWRFCEHEIHVAHQNEKRLEQARSMRQGQAHTDVSTCITQPEVLLPWRRDAVERMISILSFSLPAAASES